MNTAQACPVDCCPAATRSSYQHRYHGVHPTATDPGYNQGHQPWERTIRDDPSAPDAFLGESTNLRLVRLRLFLALVTMFAIPIIIAAPFIYGLTSRSGTSLVVPTVGLISMALVLGALTVWLARRVLEPAS